MHKAIQSALNKRIPPADPLHLVADRELWWLWQNDRAIATNTWIHAKRSLRAAAKYDDSADWRSAERAFYRDIARRELDMHKQARANLRAVETEFLRRGHVQVPTRVPS